MPDRTPGLTPPRFASYGAARSLPNIVVDGAPLPSTLLTLSHWPNNQSPPAVRRDTSTATVFAYLDQPDLHQAIPWVTNNHFDEDGLFSMYALTEPARALEDRDLLIAGSFAGDFGVVTARDGARLCFAIEALTDPEVSPLPGDVFAEPDRVAALYTAMLESLPALLRDCHDGWPRFGDLWALQDEHLAASNGLLADGVVTLVEHPALDLAVVRIPAYLRRRTARRYLVDEAAAVHPFAINSATARSRILRVQGASYEFEYRYESWVQLASRRVPLRVRLDGLAARLNQLDGGAGWVAEDPTGTAPRLHRPDGSPSSIPLDTFLLELEAALTSAPVAWDPYDWQKTGGAA
ncbi:MAG: hypothetical protein JNK40_09545 [Chromatiales bacterium]|nr:hypothetical protein [Chromatiales bacterium]